MQALRPWMNMAAFLNSRDVSENTSFASCEIGIWSFVLHGEKNWKYFTLLSTLHLMHWRSLDVNYLETFCGGEGESDEQMHQCKHTFPKALLKCLSDFQSLSAVCLLCMSRTAFFLFLPAIFVWLCWAQTQAIW